MFKMRSMAVMKQMDIVAEEMATDIIEEIKKQSDWQIGQFLPEACEGDEYIEAHSYLVRTVARHIANKLDVTTNKYYDE
tara:strand:+ start:279 stop:515 length:237 start_codon:yes stop_codon:yes gene_type:complete